MVDRASPSSSCSSGPASPASGRARAARACPTSARGSPPAPATRPRTVHRPAGVAPDHAGRGGGGRVPSTRSGGRRSTTSTSRSARGWTASAAGGGRGTTATPSPSTGRSARASRSATSARSASSSCPGRTWSRSLERLYPCHVADIRPGRSRYALLLNERGHVMDDGMILRESRDAVRADVHVRRRGQCRDVAARLDRHVGPPRPRPGPDDVARRDQRHRAPRRRAPPARSASPIRRASSATSTRTSPACPCHVMRLSFTGEAAFELHHPVDRSVELWRALMAAGPGPRDRPARPPSALRAAAREGSRHRRDGHRARHDAAPARHGLGGPDGQAAVHRPGLARADREAARPSPLGRVHDGRAGPGRGQRRSSMPTARRRRQRDRELALAAPGQGR